MDKLDISLRNMKIQKNLNTYDTQAKVNHRTKTTFEEVLNRVREHEIKFSKHALDRMEKRNIILNKEQVGKITSAMDKADSKGVREALILMDNTAFIASIKNRTIITTATSEQLKENVFTNIDGAVII